MNLIKTTLKKYHTELFVLVTVVVIISTLFMAFQIYQITARETKASQGMQQLEIARTAVTGMQAHFEHFSNDLSMLTLFPGLQNLEPAPLRARVNSFFEHTKSEGVKSIFVVDKQNQLTYSTSGSIPSWVIPLLQKNSDSKADHQKKDIWLSQVVKEDSAGFSDEFYLLIVAPLIQDYKDNKYPNPKNEFVGIVGYLISFDWLMQRYIQPIRIGETGFAWVMDQSGRLLFHPRHPEMVLKSIFNDNPKCQSCHESFDNQIALINDKFAYVEYQVSNEPAKIMAQAPMLVLNEKWIIVISMDLAEVTAIMRKNYRLFYWHVGLFMSLVIFGSIYMYRSNVRRVRAETATQLSEQKRIHQSQIDHAAKLASIGELVDIVAHEVNTPLGIISANVDTILVKDQTTPHSEKLHTIKEQTYRIADYTKSLLRFSKRMNFNPKKLDIIEVAEECLQMIDHRFRTNHIKIKKDWPLPLPLLKLDRNQIQQVFLNLLNNAADALNGPGEICVSINYDQSKTHSGIYIRITDNGPGIKTEHLPRLFDPFFSTKPGDKGTGLGLYISDSIIKRHNGSIKVTSKEGERTCFTIFIPETNEAKYG